MQGGHRGECRDCCGRAAQLRFRLGGRRHVTADTGRVPATGRYHRRRLPVASRRVHALALRETVRQQGIHFFVGRLPVPRLSGRGAFRMDDRLPESRHLSEGVFLKRAITADTVL